MSSRAVGHVLVGVGLGWVVVDRVLRRVVPAQWGGPNIGGGFILLVSSAAVAIGAVLVAAALVDGLVRRRTGLRVPARSRRPWLPWWVNGLLLAAVLLGPTILPVRANAATGGQLRTTGDAAGAPVLVLETTPPAPSTASTTVDPLDLPDGWTSTAATLPYSRDPTVLHLPSGRGLQNSLRQVSFTRDSLAGPAPDTVQYSAFDTDAQGTVDRRMAQEAFPWFVCDPLPA
ncbi:hypothetical protein JL107_13820 [Nakamurella flavida]|uniref:Uncharacterized protein n=1 Tax=Nakamurella flavida TaxID=363630 RepID=A0A939C1A7_9ACTN|nr:hypothetical protein [Nakamurella flavida]MBM9477523.1 hypothetical protein [Nakamurella flavida]MDP9777456.1 hypothetical protein [Nakamurella flavida]